jgi:hypothetical protein
LNRETPLTQEASKLKEVTLSLGMGVGEDADVVAVADVEDPFICKRSIDDV